VNRDSHPSRSTFAISLKSVKSVSTLFSVTFASKKESKKDFINDRRLQGYELYARGLRDFEIAAHLKISRRTFQYDLAVVRQQKEEERTQRQLEYAAEFDKVYTNLQSLRRYIWLDFDQLSIKDDAEMRLELYHTAMEIEDALIEAMEMRNILESKTALQRMKNKADTLKDKAEKMSEAVKEDKESKEEFERQQQASIEKEEVNTIENANPQEESQII
jgi:hypothetical protein